MRLAIFIAIVCFAPSPVGAQTTLVQDQQSFTAVSPTVSNLPLDLKQRAELESALRRRDYKEAETILIAEVDRDPGSLRAARLLVTAAGVFFLNEEYLNAAIAYKKAEAL